MARKIKSKTLVKELDKIIDLCQVEKSELRNENERLHSKIDDLSLRQAKKDKRDNLFLYLKLTLSVIVFISLSLGLINIHDIELFFHLIAMN